MADDKVTVVKEGGSGAGVVMAIVGVIALLVVAYLVFGSGLLNGDTKKIDANVKVEAPK